MMISSIDYVVLEIIGKEQRTSARSEIVNVTVERREEGGIENTILL